MIAVDLVGRLFELLLFQAAALPIELDSCWDRTPPGYRDPYFQMICFNKNSEVQRIGVFDDDEVQDNGTWQRLGKERILIHLDHIKPMTCRFRIDTASRQLILSSCTDSEYDGTWDWLYNSRD